MKRAKLSVGSGASSTTGVRAVASVPTPSRKSVGTALRHPSTEGRVGDKRKSLPAGGVATGGGGGGGMASTAAQYISAERIARIFEQSPELSGAERMREIKRVVLTLTGFNKNQQQPIDGPVVSNILNIISSRVDTVEDDDGMWNIVTQMIQYSLSPKICGSCFSALEKLINEVLIHRPNHASTVAQLLIQKFVRFGNTTTGSVVDDGPSVAEQKCFDVCMKLLCRIIEVVGVKVLTRPLLNIMSNNYPYVLKPPLTHFYYIHNLLKTNSMLGNSMTFCVLSVVIHKLTQLDSLLPRDILDSDPIQTLVLPKQENGAHLNSFVIAEDDTEELIVEILKSYRKISHEVEQSQQIATLDICLSYLISFLSRTHNSINFVSLLSIFEAEILPTFNTNCIQFVLFYLINLKEEYLNAFLNFLWKKFSNVSTPAVLRVQAVGYIAGVLARSTTADRRTVQRWMSRLSTYANEYLDSKSSQSASHWSNVNIHAHGPFYAVCQAIFYTFAFRHFELVYGSMPNLKEEDKIDGSAKPNINAIPPSSSTFIYSLNLQRLITADLNPLKACCPNVAKTFVTVAHAYQISYCKTVLERNNRASIKNMIFENMRDAAGNNEDGSITLLNESFFPFDPLPLAYCKLIVDSGFREYDRNSLALLLVGEANGMSESRKKMDDVSCDDLDLEGDDVVDNGDGGVLLVCE